MLPIPDFLPLVILPVWARLLAWFSAQVYARFLAPHDFLVQLAAHLDWAPLEQACADYHPTRGPGAQATHPVARLVRALLVKYLWQLSLRELAYAIRTNLVIKWFVGYGLFDRGPDHSPLERFEQWVSKYQPRTCFDGVLRQIDCAFPAERQQSQIGDTYALRANAAQETRSRRVRHTCQCLLRPLAEHDPAGHTAVLPQLDQTTLFGASDAVKEYRLDTAQRRTRLQTTTRAAAQCAELVRPQLAAVRNQPPRKGT